MLYRSKPLIRFKHFPLNTISPRQHVLISLRGPLETAVAVVFFLSGNKVSLSLGLVFSEAVAASVAPVHVDSLVRERKGLEGC